MPEAFQTTSLEQAGRQRAPDGSMVRPLLAAPCGSLAQFVLRPGQVSEAVRHRSVAELWYVLSGAGELWRRGGVAEGNESVVPLVSGVAISIPVGTHFQFRAGDSGLCVLGVTVPPWPDDPGEAEPVTGIWRSTG